MATTSDRRGAGGKIVKTRRIPAASRTPYSRPEKPPERDVDEDPQQNPNWLSGLIYPAKMIVSGAGKVLSFFANDYDDSSDDDNDSENDDDDEEEDVENDASFQGDDRFKVLSPSSKSDNKRAIEQLVMQETFSRAEGNELIKLIKSRVVDTNGAFDESTARMRTTAIMEARKWLQHKRSGSKEKVEHELDVTNLATPSQDTRKGKGTPEVDMAKSYMQSRPTWASPSSKHFEFGSPTPLGTLNFKEETPKSMLRSSELKKSSLSSGSWNILEEIRRVRSKATEELLAATPLTKPGLSLFSPEKDRPYTSLMNNRDFKQAESTHDRPEYVLSDVSAGRPSRANQDGDAAQSSEHKECQEATDLKLNKDNEVNESRSTAAENGFPSNLSGLAAENDATQKPRSSEEINGNHVGSIQGGPDVHMEETLNLTQVPVSDVADPNPTDSVANGSQNSSSMQQEELSQELSQPTIVEHTSPAKANDAPKERKSRGYTRRGRGRNK